TGATAADSAPLDQNWKHLYNGLDLHGWKVPAGAEERWKAVNWNLKLSSANGQTASPLWSETEIANAEYIADFPLHKDADLSRASTGFCVRGEKTPAVLIGSGTAPIVLGADKVKPGKWYRVRLKLEGSKATATLTEPQDANPQVVESTLEGA